MLRTALLLVFVLAHREPSPPRDDQDSVKQSQGDRPPPPPPHGGGHHGHHHHHKHTHCEDDCSFFVDCLYQNQANHSEGVLHVKAMQLTWDCLWSVDHPWAVESQLRKATTCTMKIYDQVPREEVEQCYVDNIYGPEFWKHIGSCVANLLAFVVFLGFVIALSCAHWKCYKPPRELTGNTGFCCCKFWCPLAAVVSVDRYQDTTAIAALFSWCGCVYTMCCWRPRNQELVAAPVNGNANYPNVPYVPPPAVQNNPSGTGTIAVQNQNWGV